MRSRIRVIGLVLLLTAGCGHQAPQRPTQRKGEAPKADSAALALMEFNQQLAVSADKQIMEYVHAQDESYALCEANTWMRIIERGDETAAAPVSGEEWTVHMRTYDLEGHLLLDSEGSYRIGKQELPPAVDTNIGALHPGGKARLVAPWYSAYGLKGTAEIPPYENVIIEITLK